MQLKEQGYEPATKTHIESLYMVLLNLPEDKLQEMTKDKSQPMIIQIIINNILWGKGFEIIEKMLDRAIWKATQKEEIKTENTTTIAISDEDARLLESVLNDNL